jgi:hypothetical protein
MAREVALEVLAVLQGTHPRNPVNDPAEVDANRRRRGLPPLYEAPPGA